MNGPSEAAQTEIGLTGGGHDSNDFIYQETTHEST